MFGHLIPNLSFAEWAVIVLAFFGASWFLRSKWNKLGMRFNGLVSGDKFNERFKELSKDLTATVEKSILAQLKESAPKVLDSSQSAKLAELVDKASKAIQETAELKKILEKGRWILIRVTIHGYKPKPDADAVTCYAAAQMHTVTGALAPAPTDFRQVTTTSDYHSRHTDNPFLTTELGAPRWHYINNDEGALMMLGARYEYRSC